MRVRLLCVGLVWAVAMCVVLMPSCAKAPKDMIGVDTTGNGLVDTYVWDLNRDNIPDRLPPTPDDPNGPLDVVPLSKGIPIAAATDAVAPTILQGVAALTGVGFLSALGLWWKARGPAMGFMNLVMTIQSLRRALKENGPSDALSIVDEALVNGSTPETVALVAKVKLKNGVKSVT